MARLSIAVLCVPFVAALDAPCYKDRSFDLSGHSALIITTSHDKLGDEDCTTCDATGVYGEELTTPYYTFKDAGLSVTIASIKGGVVPIDPKYNGSLTQAASDKRFFADPQAYEDSHHAPSISEVDFARYDIIFMAGGWGAAWDLGASDDLATKISSAYANPAQFLGSVCHGALGFVEATKPDGSLLCNGTHMTGVTNKQIQQLGIADLTPMHPEEELVKAGAMYECKHGILTDLTQNDVVVNGRIATGQNQQASCQVPQELMTMLQSRLGAVPSVVEV